MMQYLWLFPDAQGRAAFDSIRLRRAIESLDGITDWEEPPLVSPELTLFGCQLEAGGVTSPIPIRVDRNLRSVSVGAYHDVGLNAALKIQRHYGGEMYAWSEEASPELFALSRIETPAELADKLQLRG